MKLTFADRLAYVRGEGFRTPVIALPFGAVSGFYEGEDKMAHPARFERATP